MSKEKVEIEQVLDLPTAISHLEDVLSGLKKGSLTLTQGLDTVTLNVPGVVELEMTASRKKEKQKICIELSWKNDRDADAGQVIRIG